MTLSNHEIDARLPVWEALAELFLDNELDETDYEIIAERVLASGFSLSKVQTVLWNEVLPALGDNLRIGTGEWAYFESGWLVERVNQVIANPEAGFGEYGLITPEQVACIIEERWRRVCECCPDVDQGR